ncbi:MAG TPA: PBP1A family penicillin-binding protein [Gemmatimonadaceae bacterium]|nr:PBP1A family penicillin-binding protein [Gemmatimonadaceae bacterium]
MLRNRFHILRQRLRTPSAEPFRTWARRDWWKLSLLGVGVIGIVGLNAWLLSCGFQGCPSRSEIRAYRPSEGGSIRDENDRLIGHLAIVRRINVPLAQIPKHVRQAFVSTEDRRFFEHNGIDWRGVGRAVVRNISAMGVREGFSTITMQVARNSFLVRRYNGRSMRRKMIELRLARILERELTKEQILEHYLNVIYLGNGVYGVEAASRDLFGKSVTNVSLAEAATLAALPKGPSLYTPRDHPDRARRRRDLVLGLMADQGYIDRSTAQRAQSVPVRVASTEWRPSQYDAYGSIDAVRALVDSVLPDALQEGDVIIHTTIDARTQNAADKVIARHAASIQNEGWGNSERLQGALVAIDPQTGDIRALVGGRRSPRGGFIRAIHAKRQPGSAFKPFVYAAALASGISPATLVDDEPVEVMIGNTPWIPANYDDNYQGTTTVRRALMFSANAATVRISRVVGEQRVIQAARNNGITSDLKPVPSIALGALEVTPLELVTAYAPFANGGVRVRPRLVTRIEAPDGKVLWSQEVERVPAMDPRDAYELTSMLRAVVDYGTGKVIRDYGITAPVAGKTGTTNNGADVWFIGYTPTLVAGVWFGYDTPRQIAENAAGGRFAAPAWAEFYKTGWRERSGVEWMPPNGMVSAIIDPETGQLATEWCPRRVREWFKPGTQPNAPCDLHTEPAPQVIADDNGNVVVPDQDWLGQLGKRLKRILRF